LFFDDHLQAKDKALHPECALIRPSVVLFRHLSFVLLFTFRFVSTGSVKCDKTNVCPDIVMQVQGAAGRQAWQAHAQKSITVCSSVLIKRYEVPLIAWTETCSLQLRLAGGLQHDAKHILPFFA